MASPRARGSEAPPASRPDVLPIAAVVGAHGVRGAVRIRLHHGADAELLRPGSTLVVRRAGAPDVELAVRACAPIPGGRSANLELSSVADRDGALALRGAELALRRRDLDALGPDEFYVADTHGCEVVRVLADGTTTSLGRVAGLTSNGAQDLLEVRFAGGTWLLPLVAGFVREVADGRVVVDLPDGIVPEELESP